MDVARKSTLQTWKWIHNKGQNEEDPKGPGIKK